MKKGITKEMEENMLEYIKKKLGEYKKERKRMPKMSDEEIAKITLIGWTGWDTARRRIDKGEYKDCYKLRKKEIKQIIRILVEYFTVHHDKLTKEFFNGSCHQNAPRGVPLFKHCGSIYAYMTTMRRWGDLVAKVLSKIDNKKYESLESIQKKIEYRVKNKIEEPLVAKNTYCYLDFAWSWERETDSKDNKTNKDS